MVTTALRISILCKKAPEVPVRDVYVAKVRAKDFFREIVVEKDRYDAYNSDQELYVFTKAISWVYEQERPYKGDTIKK